jgi:methyl-accepting chemotaxis protein/nitric oxide dioxygenase
MLNAKDAAQLRETWTLLEPSRRAMAVQFLQRLFAEEPGLRARFPQDIEESMRRCLTLLDFIVDHAEDRESLQRTLQRLGRRYLDEGVGRKEISAAGLAWMWTLERQLGAELTQARLMAWSQVMAFLARSLREAVPALAS